MFKVKQKISSILVACLAALFAFVLALGVFSVMPKVTANAADQTETLSIYANKGTVSGTTISWLGDHFTFTNIKGSTDIRTSDSDHYRAYSGSTGAISSKNGEIIIKVVITCTASSYTDECQTAFKSTSTATISGSTVIITPTESNATSITYKSTASAQWRLSKIVITYQEASSEPACEHANTTTETTDATCTVAGSIVVTCNDCGETVSTEEIPATGHVNTTTTTTEADCTTAGSIVVTCDDCGETVSNTPIPATGHDFDEPTYERNGDQHTATGTCTVCGETTSETEDCTLTNAYTSNNDETHNITSTCSVCNESVITENVACTFGEPVLSGSTLTYTCEYCEYIYTEEATMYTVSYSVAGNITETVEVADGYTTELIEADAEEGYTFVGWATAPLDEKTETAPEFFKEGDDYEVTEDVTLYALYTYSEGTGAFTLVKDVANLAVGKEIVIAASGYNYALSTTQNGNNRGQVDISKSNDTITWTTAVQVITLEAGKTTETWAFNVGNGYLHVASSSSNYLRTQTTLDDNASWKIEITSAGIATIKAQGSYTRNWLRYNSSSKIFSCYGSGQADISIYVKTGGATTFYTTAIGDACQHENTRTETTPATCTETGVEKVICNDCEYIVSETELEATGHNFVDGLCTNENCGEQDPATIDYSGYYYISFTHSETTYYADNSQLSSNRYYAKTEAPASDAITAKYVYRLVKTATGIYSLYEFDGDLYQANITVENVDGVYRFYATTADGDCQFLLNAGNATKYIKFYKASNATNANYAQDITLTPVELPAKIEGSQVTLGDDIKANIYVSIDEAFAENATLQYTLDGKDYTIEEYTQVGDKYVFTFIVLPQCMANEFELQLVIDGNVLDTVKYSVKAYAQTILNDTEGEYSDEAKALVSEMLRYGAAAQTYKGYNPENLVTNGVENMTAENTEAIDDNQFALETEEVEVCYAYFTGANVLFNDVNQLAVKVSSTENVTISITKQGEAESEAVAITSTTVLTEGIVATEFDTVYVFKLYYNGELMQTLTYSINSYCVRTLASTTTSDNMKALATATYYYGLAADVYAQSLQG